MGLSQLALFKFFSGMSEVDSSPNSMAGFYSVFMYPFFPTGFSDSGAPPVVSGGVYRPTFAIRRR